MEIPNDRVNISRRVADALRGTGHLQYFAQILQVA